MMGKMKGSKTRIPEKPKSNAPSIVVGEPKPKPDIEVEEAEAAEAPEPEPEPAPKDDRSEVIIGTDEGLSSCVQD